MNLTLKYFILIGFILSCISCKEKSYSNHTDKERTTIESTSNMARRILKSHSQKFKFELIESANGLDVFEIEYSRGKIIVRGTNGIAIASGLNWYLKKYCNSHVSMNYNQIQIPDRLPKIKEKIRVETPFEYRYLFNYCTYGYSMPWWNWEKWEQMIDYMAFMGVNIPLATIGQEAVWYEVYKELGLSDKQLDEFFVGPAHLPWGWMGNIDGMCGPLPRSWINQRAELQKKVLERMRSLGMKPVLQGFTGHVPKELKEIFPNADIMQIHDWAGIPGTMYLNPTDSLFSKIGTLFIKKQTEMFGTDHLYDADCFIEVDPPSNDTAFLANVSNTVYQSMAAADPEAIWVVQGWFFFFRSKFWQSPQGKAFVGGVPKDKIIVLDLYGEKNTTWDKTEAFFGQPWIWNVICNEDQKVNMSGDLQQMETNFQAAYTSEIDNNLRGIGTIPEGVGYNPVVQEFIYEKAWNQEELVVEKWIEDYAKRRYGTTSTDITAAWKLLLESVYSRTRTDWLPLITTPYLQLYESTPEDIRHVRKQIRITNENPFGQDFDVKKLYEAAKLLLQNAEEFKDIEAYRFDMTNIHRELLASLTYRKISNLSRAYANRDEDELGKAAQELLNLLDDMNSITGTNQNFLLGKWIEDARSWGTNIDEKDYLEWNARTIVTIWQPFENGGLRDYAGKQWNGLLSNYYKPRWELLIDMLSASLKEDSEFNPKDYDKAIRKIDYNWTKQTNKFPTEITGDVIEEARRIHTNYSNIFED